MTLAVLAAATAGPVIPNYGAQSSSCVVHNHLFCADWVSQQLGAGAVAGAAPAHRCSRSSRSAIGFVIAMALALAAHRYRLARAPDDRS